MKLIRLVALVVIGTGLCSAPAFAGNGRGINARQASQQRRIYQGIRSGELTPGEAARLESQEARIAALEARDRHSGGGLSPQERLTLERALNRESRQIYRQKHDPQQR